MIAYEWCSDCAHLAHVEEATRTACAVLAPVVKWSAQQCLLVRLASAVTPATLNRGVNSQQGFITQHMKFNRTGTNMLLTANGLNDTSRVVCRPCLVLQRQS